MSRKPMITHDEWVQAALDARVEQGLPEEIEDPDTLDFLADVLSKAPERVTSDQPY